MNEFNSHLNIEKQSKMHEKYTLFEIAHDMKEAQLPEAFIVFTIQAALEYEGIADLVNLWAQETNTKERDEIIADIQELLDDCANTQKKEYTYIKFNDLEAISENIREFKDKLLQIVDEHGGVTQLSELTDIPQPSLSRFFNSNAMPRRITLLKIAKALNLDAIQVETKWAR